VGFDRLLLVTKELGSSWWEEGGFHRSCHPDWKFADSVVGTATMEYHTDKDPVLMLGSLLFLSYVASNSCSAGI